MVRKVLDGLFLIVVGMAIMFCLMNFDTEHNALLYYRSIGNDHQTKIIWLGDHLYRLEKKDHLVDVNIYQVVYIGKKSINGFLYKAIDTIWR